MDEKLRTLKAEFERFVGQPVGVTVHENKRNRLVRGRMQEVMDKTLSIHQDDPVAQEMQQLAFKFGAQVLFEGVITAGLGGVAVKVELAEKEGRHVIAKITPEYV